MRVLSSLYLRTPEKIQKILSVLVNEVSTANVHKQGCCWQHFSEESFRNTKRQGGCTNCVLMTSLYRSFIIFKILNHTITGACLTVENKVF